MIEPEIIFDSFIIYKCEICESDNNKREQYHLPICDQCKSDLKDYVTWKRKK